MKQILYKTLSPQTQPRVLGSRCSCFKHHNSAQCFPNFNLFLCVWTICVAVCSNKCSCLLSAPELWNPDSISLPVVANSTNVKIGCLTHREGVQSPYPTAPARGIPQKPRIPQAEASYGDKAQGGDGVSPSLPASPNSFLTTAPSSWVSYREQVKWITLQKDKSSVK